MWIKLLGSVLLGVSGVLSALSVCRFHRRRLDTLDGFISLILYIKGQVECYARPIGEILSELPAEILRDCNCPMGAGSIEEMIEESRMYLDRDTLRLLLAFSGEFGSVFREEQTKRCDHYVLSLRDRRDAAAERVGGDMRSGCAACIGLAICVTILLW